MSGRRSTSLKLFRGRNNLNTLTKTTTAVCNKEVRRRVAASF